MENDAYLTARKYPLPIVPDDIDVHENAVLAPVSADYLLVQQQQQQQQQQCRHNNNTNDDLDSASMALALELQQLEIQERAKQKRLAAQRYQEDLRLAQTLHDRDRNDKDSVAKQQQQQRQRQQQQHDCSSSYTRRQQRPPVRLKLAPCQERALRVVHETAWRMHQTTLPALQQRVQQLGGFATDTAARTALELCLAYIQDEAPIIIHLTADTLTCLAADTHYRNLFDTGTSGGKNCVLTRQRWEDALFGRAYHNVRDGSLRPKYACLNITGDVRGCLPARRHYGKLYLTLRPHVRSRVTLSDDDTGRNHDPQLAALATTDAYAHVLYRYRDADLTAVLQVAASTRWRRIRGVPSQGRTTTYKECQIHGPVRLATDVEALSLPGHEATASESFKRTVRQFQTLTACNVMWQGDLLEDSYSDEFDL